MIQFIADDNLLRFIPIILSELEQREVIDIPESEIVDLDKLNKESTLIKVVNHDQIPTNKP